MAVYGLLSKTILRTAKTANNTNCTRVTTNHILFLSSISRYIRSRSRSERFHRSDNSWRWRGHRIGKNIHSGFGGSQVETLRPTHQLVCVFFHHPSALQHLPTPHPSHIPLKSNLTQAPPTFSTTITKQKKTKMAHKTTQNDDDSFLSRVRFALDGDEQSKQQKRTKHNSNQFHVYYYYNNKQIANT